VNLEHTEEIITRPLVHFTAERNWINDPNGLVYLDGEYHLFYQHNPFGDTWGHMHWGHAVSRDLVRWEHLPVALAETENHMIYSGCAVVDWHNSSGFGMDGQPPLVAVFTAHYTDRALQNQHIAYSTDKGRTWTTHTGNPVLDIGEADFRDPKVFWHEPTRRWIMLVSLAVQRKLSFYSSKDLKSWTHLSDFGPTGSVEGIWECPDIFPLPVIDDPGREKWVLLLNVNPGHPAGGSGCQYFVGHFDGMQFRAETDEVLWLDHGADFYAAVSWSDIPASDGRRIMIGWMNNWTYAGKTPTGPWRGMMSIPRAVALRTTNRGCRLVQLPIGELSRFYGHDSGRFEHGSFEDASAWLKDRKYESPAMDVSVTMDGVEPGMRFGMIVDTGRDEYVTVTCDADAGRLIVDRTQSGHTAFSELFTGMHEAPLDVSAGTVELRFLLDSCSLELFAQGGEVALSDQIFPTSDTRRLRLFSDGRPPASVKIEIHPIVLRDIK